MKVTRASVASGGAGVSAMVGAGGGEAGHLLTEQPKSDFCSFAVDTCEIKKIQEKSVSSPSPPVSGIAFAELWINFRRSFACARYLSVTRCLTIRNSVLPLSASQI